MNRLALVALCVLGLSGFALAQPAGGGFLPGGGTGGTGGALPANCGQIDGDFTVDAVDTAAITVTLTGDVAGTLAGTVAQSHSHTFGFGTISFTRFTGTVTTATGTLEVTGRLMQISFTGMPMPGAIGITGSIEFLKLIVTGGTGDTADQVGIIVGMHNTLTGPMPLPPSANQGYHGVLCTPAAPPAPTP
jgi:hypothetical protein